MNIAEILENMGTSGIIGSAWVVLTLLQVTPIKINPWSTIAKVIGRALNVELMDRVNENEANNVRYRIIRFDDEIRHHIKHTEEHFNQVIEDIDKYEDYCEKHPLYENNKAKMAIKNVKETYERCRSEHSFLP
jgi:arginine decarboxylase-like protein